MSTANQAKDALEQAVVTFNRNKSSLSKAVVSAGGGSSRSLELKIGKLEDSLAQLNLCHTAWVIKAKLVEDETALSAETYSRTWLEARWSEVDEICDSANEIIEAEAKAAEPRQLQPQQQRYLLEKQMETLQSNLKKEIETLHASTSTTTINTTTHELYTTMITNADNQLNGYFGELSQQLLALSGDQFNNVCAQHEAFKQTHQKTIVEVRIKLAQLAPSPDTAAPTPDPSARSQSRSLEMEKSRAPTFSGNILDYPEFKRGWCKVAGAAWDDANQLEQIKLKVDAYTKKIISRCKDMAEVWESLDTEYAEEQEVVNAVNAELQKLRSDVCSTPEFIVKLRNHLPGLEETLKAVNGLEHLKTPDKVNYLVEKFDERTQYEWEYFRSKETAGTTYDRFFNFILDRYNSCRSMIARQRSREFPPPPPPPPHTVHHVTMSCYKCKTWVAKGGSVTCPGCGHTANEGEPIGHCLEHCSKYSAMTVSQRSICLQNAQWCPVHLSSTHDLNSCTLKMDPKLICGVGGCQKHHHRSLHGCTDPFVASINHVSMHINDSNSAADLSGTDNTLLAVQNIATQSGNMDVLFDNASTCCLILNSTAERLQLQGEEVVIGLETVNKDDYVHSHLYNINLVDRAQNIHQVKAFGVPKISGAVGPVNIDELKTLFTEGTQNNWGDMDNRPTGEIEFLLGGNYLGLHPTDHECIGNVKVMKSIFGTGFLIAGRHASIKSSKIAWDATVAHLRVHHTRLSFKSVREYLDSYDIAVPTPRRCKDCMNCSECSFRGHQMSLQEQYEYQVMEDKVHYDEVNQEFRVEYAFIESPSILANNLRQVVKIAEREEKKLHRECLTDAFNKEFQKMLDIGALVELTAEDRQSWKGDVHYVSLQHVPKPESTTTPLRIVSNSSLSDRNGISLNSILMKGPNVLSNQFDILSRWRSYEEGFCSDLTKAYFSMKTGEVEKHLRRVVWRFGDTSAAWRQFAFQTVSFGDKPAGVYLDIVVNKTADLFQEIDPEAAKKIKKDRYVDDLATGGSSTSVQRFKGNELDDYKTDGTVSQILGRGSLNLKAIVTSGEDDAEKVDRLGSHILGLGWDPERDIISVDMRGNKSTTNIELDNIILTKRVILGIINKTYDLLGLLSPITIQLKVAYRNLFRLEDELGWDDEIPSSEHLKWRELLTLVNEVGCVEFPRATKPGNAVGKPTMIGYFDGSDDAYAAVIYYRWLLRDGSVECRLVTSNAKVTPLKRISTPRAELNGAVLLSRLVLSTIKGISESESIPSKVWLLGDSECTLSSIEKTSGAFGEYFGNRVGEILDNQSQIEQFCEVGNDGEWWHVKSKDNAADRPSRIDSTLADVSPNSPWQTGPAYLRTPIEEWPMNREFAARKDSAIPSVELLKKYREIIQNVNVEVVSGIQNLIDPKSTNSWSKLVHRTQLLLHATDILRKQGNDDIASRFEAAEQLWFKFAMVETKEAQENGRLKNLLVEERDGVIVVVGRSKKGIQKLLGKDCLPVLMSKSRVAELIMLWAHYQNHDARDITMAIACRKAWIVRAKSLATSITRSCLRCRFLHKRKLAQQMANLPQEIQLPCPPFTNIGVDLSGPLTVHAMTNKRATLKVWVVIFVCLNTKAVTMYLAPGYSTDDFMLAYNSHTSDHGLPNKVHSDKGSQLVAAGKEIEFEWDLIAERASTQGTRWDLAPAGAQWRNGAVEIFVKKFKKSFELLYAKTRMNFAEMSCAVKRVANVLNDRPLSVQKSLSQYPDEDFLLPITPNMLVTGRSGSLPPAACEESDVPEDRLSYIEELERAWWYQYKVQHFSSLIPRQKWLSAERNLSPGDVVLIEYKSKSFPGTYRLGRVKDVEVDDDGLVRTCTVVYKLIKTPMNNVNDVVRGVTTKEIRVPTQRLVLILPVEEQ